MCVRMPTLASPIVYVCAHAYLGVTDSVCVRTYVHASAVWLPRVQYVVDFTDIDMKLATAMPLACLIVANTRAE